MTIATGSITLGGIDLNNSLLWTNKYEWIPVADNNRRTLGGSQVVFTQDLLQGQPIILQATQDTGWLTKAMIDAITALTLDADQTRVFVFHGETINVRFDYNGQAPIAFKPLQAKQVLAGTDYMIGSINLYSV